MYKQRSVTPAWIRDAKEAIATESRFRVIRATDTVPGRKTMRELRARTDRTPFRAEIEIACSVMDRAVYSGSREIVEHAADELFDMALAFSKFIGQITQEGRARVATIETGEAA